MLVAESGELDAVAILTPTPQHAEQVEAFLAAGFDVICEKSLTESSDESRKLDEQASTSGRFLCTTYNYSGYPMMRELRERIGNGDLGRIVSIHVEMPQEGFLRRDATGNAVSPQAWRQRDGAVPTVSLDLGTHTHHLVQFLLGAEPIELVANQAHHGRVSNVADYVSCLARYPDDIDVDMWFGKSAIGNRNGLRIRVYGDEGSAEWVQMRPEEISIADDRGNLGLIDRSSPRTKVAALARYERFKAGHPAGFLEAFANLYWDYADALPRHRAGESDAGPYISTGRDDACGLLMMEAIARSAAEHAWCRVPDYR